MQKPVTHSANYIPIRSCPSPPWLLAENRGKAEQQGAGLCWNLPGSTGVRGLLPNIVQVLHSRSYQYQGRAQGPGFCECSVIRLDRGTLRVDRREFVDLGALSQDMGFNILARILEDNKHFH